MNEVAKTGKRRTLLISVSILLVSIHTIYFYHAVRLDIDAKKLIQQIVRFLLTGGLLVLVYKGKTWAKNVSLVLFSLATISSLIGLFTLETNLVNKVPLMVMVFVYTLSTYHFGFSKSFKAFIASRKADH